MNHHVGAQPLSAPSAGYAVTRFATSTTTMTGSVSTPVSLPPSFPPPFRVQMQGGQNLGTGVPTLLPPPGYSKGSRPPSPNPYGSQPVGYTTRSTRSGLGTSPPQGTSQPQRYSETRSSLPPPQFTSISHSRSYSAATTTFPPRPQGERPTIRIREYQPPPPYDLRHPPERRQPMPPSPQQMVPQSSSRGTPSFPATSPMHPRPPPSPSRRQGHRRTASEMDVPHETEEERIRKRRRSDRGP